MAAVLFRLLYSDRPILDHRHAVQGSVSPKPLFFKLAPMYRGFFMSADSCLIIGGYYLCAHRQGG